MIAHGWLQKFALGSDPADITINLDFKVIRGSHVIRLYYFGLHEEMRQNIWVY